MKAVRYKIALLSLLSLPAMLLVAVGGPAAAAPHGATGTHTNAVTTSSLGSSAPTFVGPAATGCASAGCDLLSGPIHTPSTASLTASQTLVRNATSKDLAKALPYYHPRVPSHGRTNTGTIQIPTVSCQPLRPGCDNISGLAGGATGVLGLNAVDSATHTANIFKDVEPPDQGICAGNGFAVETNNVGEILIFNKNLNRVSPVISLDTLMGLTKKNWSSGGDPECIYDPSNGGHWFFTEFVSTTPESAGGPFAGCFAAVADTCMEGIAVTKGNNPFGPYNVYFLNANYNPNEPGTPYLLNDYAKIATTRDAFMLFYDEFPLRGGGFGGGFFNGAQQYAFNKTALEKGMPTTLSGGKPNPAFTVAVENMGLLKTPNGTCASDNKYFLPGIACWFSVIPAMAAPGQWDNSDGGTGFMVATLDFYSLGGNQIAAFDWTHLKDLNSAGCSACSGIRFGGQVFSHVAPFYDATALPSGAVAVQKAGPIPLGDECGAAGLSTYTSCPENGVATNSDQATQASQGDGNLWFGVNTQVEQLFSSTNVPELHQGAVYYVLGIDEDGGLDLSNQGYVSAAHEELAFPAIASGASNGHSIMSFTLSGNGGEFAADNGGFFPSSAFGRLTASSHGLLQSTVNIADLGQSPQDGFTEYQGYPGGVLLPRPRWGDYGNAILMGNQYYFASEYIQSPNCAPPQFTLTIGTCGGTRDGNANWGTSMNVVSP